MEQTTLKNYEGSIKYQSVFVAGISICFVAGLLFWFILFFAVLLFWGLWVMQIGYACVDFFARKDYRRLIFLLLSGSYFVERFWTEYYYTDFLNKLGNAGATFGIPLVLVIGFYAMTYYDWGRAEDAVAKGTLGRDDILDDA